MPIVVGALERSFSKQFVPSQKRKMSMFLTVLVLKMMTMVNRISWQNSNMWTYMSRPVLISKGTWTIKTMELPKGILAVHHTHSILTFKKPNIQSFGSILVKRFASILSLLLDRLVETP
jgi:hypothetical protein